MVQLFALEIDLGAAQMLSQALGEIKRARAADIMGAEMLQFRLEFRIGLGLIPLRLQVEDQRHQGFGNETAAENAEAPILIRPGLERIQVWCLVHLLLPANALAPAASARATASKNSSMRPRSLIPGALSTPEDVSIALAPVSARASPIFCAFKPPESM